MTGPVDDLEDTIYRYVLAAGDITFRRLLSYVAQHSPYGLRRDRIALVLGSMASKNKIQVYRSGAEWRIRQAKPEDLMHLSRKSVRYANSEAA